MQGRCRRVGTLGLVVSILGLSSAALAGVSIERSGSIVVFPKVIVNASADPANTVETIIQITNTSNSVARAHCFYVNAALTDPNQPPGPMNPPLWQEVDFDIHLTRQQPTYWQVSKGRLVNPLDPVCGPANADCGDAGFDPGRVPPVLPDFRGELKCIQVDDSGAPVNGNSLKGEATMIRGDDVSKYNAIAILGAEDGLNNGDNVLVLGGGQCAGEGPLKGAVCIADADCEEAGPCVLEYNACPQTWILDHLADGAPNPALEQMGAGPSAVFTELTIAPCTENFETQVPTRVTLQFLTWNEFESQFSVSTSVECWGNFALSDLGSLALTFEGQSDVPDLPLGTMYLQTRIRAAGGTPFGVLMVAEERHISDPLDDAWAAMNLHVEGERSVPDVITIPGEQLSSSQP